MLFHNQLELILPNFTEAEQSYIRDMVDFNAHDLSPEDEYILLKIIQSIDETSSQAKKDYLIDIFEKIYVRQSPPNFYIVNEGEDFNLTIRLRKTDDFTGTILLIRNAENGNALTDVDQAGTSDSEQTVTITDIDLSAGDFYKLWVLTESPNGQSEASGNGLNLIDTIYMYVGEDIDTI